jgi:hypothetical protein
MAAQPVLMAATRESLRKYDAGPREPVRALARYLDAERDLGRVAAGADTGSIAALLMGACFQQAFLYYFTAEPDDPDQPVSAAAALVRPLLPALLP